MKMFLAGVWAAAGFAALQGCTHVKGIVTDEVTHRPVPSAIFSIGRPDGIAVYATHHVDGNGKFDFSVFSLDESNVYVYDGAGDPRMTMQHLDRTALNADMHVKLFQMENGGGETTP